MEEKAYLNRWFEIPARDYSNFLIDHYVTESQARLLTIKEAVSNNDAQTLEFEVHTPW